MSIASKLMLVSKSSGALVFSTPGTYTWTVPSGVTELTTLSGQGGSSTTEQTWVASDFKIGVDSVPFTSSLPSQPDLFWSEVQNKMDSQVALINSVTTSPSGESFSFYSAILYRYYTLSEDWVTLNANFQSGTFRRIATVLGNATLEEKSGTVSEPPTFENFQVTPGLQRLTSSTVYGTDSTAFGKTFPDDSEPVFYTNVAVVPRQTYTIVVGTDQGADTSFVSFEWQVF